MRLNIVSARWLCVANSLRCVFVFLKIAIRFKESVFKFHLGFQKGSGLKVEVAIPLRLICFINCV